MPKQKPAPAEGPVAYTLSVIGSSWTCLILRDLLQHGARRFQDLQDSLDGIAPTTLSERLRTLEQNGVVERRFYLISPPSARLWVPCEIGDASTRGDPPASSNNLVADWACQRSIWFSEEWSHLCQGLTRLCASATGPA